VGGCPLMYCEPVDFAHRCMCALLRWRGRVPRWVADCTCAVRVDWFRPSSFRDGWKETGLARR